MKLMNFLNKIKVNEQTGCWEWTGCISTNGYGQIGMSQRKKWQAHRFSYWFYISDIPEGMLICHKCDNKKCVNPKHLFIGTQKDNIQDAINKNRMPNGEQHWTHIYPEKVMPFFLGKHHTKESIEKIKNASIGRLHTEKSKQKMQGLHCGEKNKQSKLTQKDIINIIKDYIPYHRQYGGRALSKKYNISQQEISNIVNNKRWQFISRESK